jgi:hypothetical protein
MREKLTKSQVNYHISRSPVCCEGCKFSQLVSHEDKAKCVLLEDEVTRGGVCDWWLKNTSSGVENAKIRLRPGQRL